MAFPTITGAGSTTATKFFGDAMNRLSNMLNGVDISADATVTIHTNVTWTFQNTALRIQNPAATFSYTITPSALGANRALTLPLLTADDTVAVLALSQAFTNKTLNDSNVTFISNGDVTKKLAFSCTGITTATTRTITIPDISSTMAVTGLSQTFTQAQIIQIPSGSNSLPSNAMFQAIGDGTRTSLYFDDYGAAASSIQFRRANGTLASPTKTLANDNIVAINVRGYEQVSPAFTGVSAQIIVTATEDYDNTKNGAKIRFYTVATGTTTITEAFDIHNNADLAMKATAKFFYDGVTGAGDTYRSEAAANDLIDTVGGIQAHELVRGATTTTEVNTVIGKLSALATNTSDGFLYMPSGAGTPTGTPTSFTGKVAFYYDSTNNIIYIYNGAWKKTAALT